MIARERLAHEYLEADGLGGFASGTVGGLRTRRYHATLLVATTPPTGRGVLVAGFDAWIEREGRPPQFLTSQRYLPEVEALEGQGRLTAFTTDPWPTWTFRLEGGGELIHELFTPHGHGAVALRWHLRGSGVGGTLVVRPFLAARDAHANRHESAELRFEAQVQDPEHVVWDPDPRWPAVHSRANATYEHAPVWYRAFRLEEERARGYDWTEDLAAPGILRWDLDAGPAVWVLAAEAVGDPLPDAASALTLHSALATRERARRAAFPSPLHRAADAYVVRRGSGRTIVAGYPWFTDWGRDTFISLRGLCLATGRLDEAREILLQWAGAVSQGMLPNRFLDQGDDPEFNSVDAALWFILGAEELMELAEHRRPGLLSSRDVGRLHEAIDAILAGYTRGTRHGIRADKDGLLLAGAPGQQLTWMDARIDDWVVTPRTGKPVEIQALWLQALRFGGSFSARWRQAFLRALPVFQERFWLPDQGYLADVVDVDGSPGTVDASLRPNQLFAVGGLPLALIDGPRARQVVEAVERALWTPMGPRSLSGDDPRYAGVYLGDQRTRDAAYHQGTVWPWLAGPFIQAWIRAHGSTEAAKTEARARFLGPLQQHLSEAGLGHVSEIADGNAPHTPRGAPFQAWSLGELLRLELGILGPPNRRAAPRRLTAVAP